MLFKNKNNKTLNGTNFENHYKITPMWLQIVLLLAGLFGLSLIAMVVSKILQLMTNDKAILNLAINTTSYSLLFILMITLIIFFARHLFLQFKNVKAIAWGLLSFAAIYAASVAYSLIISIFIEIAPNNNESAVRDMVNNFPAISIITIVFLGPICEELTYRVGLFDLVKRKNSILAYVVTIAIFALIHFDFTAEDMVMEFVNLPQYMIAGFILTYTYNKYGLAASVAAHIFNNAFSVISTLVA